MHHIKVKPAAKVSPDGRSGTIYFIFIFRTPEGSSKGCAFIKLQTAQQAMTAIQQMHGSQTMPVSFLIYILYIQQAYIQKYIIISINISSSNLLSYFELILSM